MQIHKYALAPTKEYSIESSEEEEANNQAKHG